MQVPHFNVPFESMENPALRASKDEVNASNRYSIFQNLRKECPVLDASNTIYQVGQSRTSGITMREQTALNISNRPSIVTNNRI
jgi:hypothetical protein